MEFGQELEQSIKMTCKDNEEDEKEESREDAEDTFYCVTADDYNVKLSNDT